MNRPNTLDPFWMSFSANRNFRQDPRPIVFAEGVYDSGQDGQRILDATAGLRCVNAGHRDPRITAPLVRDFDRFDDAPGLDCLPPVSFARSSRISETGTCHDV